ncbi:DUF2612 domain-containing protein [Bacillus sp. FSL W8-0519]|uniref:DUF2612 domain-containing protein n=1 Tax=Bacillus sp. FSL W8-0519 TaxID=2954624 RepID=UPI0030FB9441
MTSVYQKLIKRITDNYRRDDNSNVSKMMRLAAHHIQENEDLLNKIHDWRDIDQVEGVTLDYIGRNIGQDRMGFDDDTFRGLIKARIIRNNSDGTIPTILRFLSFILGVEKNHIRIREKWKAGEPVGLYIEIDMEFVLNLGIAVEDFGYIVNELVVCGVHADIYFVGSFMFSDYEDEIQIDSVSGLGQFVSNEFFYPEDFYFSSTNDSQMDKETGFANYEEGQGGKLGGYFKMNTFKDGTQEVLKPW